MGGWKLEIMKMAIYMAFPVGLFHFFNQPQYFEEWVTTIKREMYPPENLENRRKLEECMNEMHLKEEYMMLKALEEHEKA